MLADSTNGRLEIAVEAYAIAPIRAQVKGSVRHAVRHAIEDYPVEDSVIGSLNRIVLDSVLGKRRWNAR